MSDNGIIFKISSPYRLKSILSYIDYNTALKLVKYNKCLQKKLDINIKDYSLDYELKEKIEKEYYDFKSNTPPNFKLSKYFLFFEFILFRIFSTIISGIIIIHAEKEKQSNPFNKIIIFAAILVLFNVQYSFICCACILALKRKKAVIIGIILEIFIHFIIILFAFLLLLELSSIYESKIRNIIITAFLILIIFIIVYVISLLVFLIVYKLVWYKKNIESYFIKFKGIKIDDFAVLNNFYDMNPGEKKKYVLNRAEK